MDKPRLSLVVVKPVTHNSPDLSPHWDDAVNDWLDWLKVGGSSFNTRRLRREHVVSIARRSGVDHPRQMTLALIVELCSERNWSNEYRKGIRTSLISFFEYCRSVQLVDQNPAELLPRVPSDTPRPRPAPDDVWRDLLAAADPRVRMMARLAGEAGLRRSEVAQIRRDDLVRDRNGWALIVLGKGSKQRVVPITDSLATAIVEFRQHGYLFPGPNGHVSAPWVGAMISRLMPEGFSMHKLRHRYASRGYAGTGNLRAVQEALGHASVATTERYTAVTRDDVRRVSEAAGASDGGVA